MALERIEVAIAMKQLMAFDDTECRDNRVDGFAHGHAARAQRPVITRRRNCDLTAGHRAKFECGEVSEGALKFEIRSKSLQYFHQNQIAHQQVLRSKQPIEQIGPGSRAPVEVIDLHRSIHHGHECASTISAYSVEIALPFELAAKTAEPFLLLEPHHQAQRGFNRLALGARARRAHRASHQLVVDYDIGPHRVTPLCMLDNHFTHRKKTAVRGDQIRRQPAAADIVVLANMDLDNNRQAIPIGDSDGRSAIEAAPSGTGLRARDCRMKPQATSRSQP